MTDSVAVEPERTPDERFLLFSPDPFLESWDVLGVRRGEINRAGILTEPYRSDP